MSNRSLGSYGESLARQYLKAQGYRILEENFRNKLGEIDLIAQDGKTVCFVEVKTRQSCTQGQPYEAINPWKIRKLSQMAAQSTNFFQLNRSDFFHSAQQLLPPRSEATI